MFRDFIKEALGSEYQEDGDGLVAVLGNLPFKTKSVGALRAFREDAWTDLASQRRGTCNRWFVEDGASCPTGCPCSTSCCGQARRSKPRAGYRCTGRISINRTVHCVASRLPGQRGERSRNVHQRVERIAPVPGGHHSRISD